MRHAVVLTLGGTARGGAEVSIEIERAWQCQKPPLDVVWRAKQSVLLFGILLLDCVPTGRRRMVRAHDIGGDV